MERPGKHVQWSPTGKTEKSESDRRRAWAAVGVALVVWTSLGAFSLADGGGKGNDLAQVDKTRRNMVSIMNDSRRAVYYVACRDDECKETSGGTRPGDYDLSTAGNSQKLWIERSKQKTITVGVFDEDRHLTGCLRITTSDSKQPVSNISLSSSLRRCSKLS